MSMGTGDRQNLDYDKHDRSDRIDHREMIHLTENPNQQMPYKGWSIRFVGWRQEISSLIEFGVWVATKDDDRGYWYATTNGVCAYNPSINDPFDLAVTNDVRPVVETRAVLARRALDKLCESLDRLSQRVID